MRLTWKDTAATLFTALAVLTFAATHEGWNVWLVGDSRRWATGVILVLGIASCAQGSHLEGSRLTRFLALLGIAALVLAVAAFWTGSLTALSLLVADFVVLWAASTSRHLAHRPPAAPLAS